MSKYDKFNCICDIDYDHCQNSKHSHKCTCDIDSIKCRHLTKSDHSLDLMYSLIIDNVHKCICYNSNNKNLCKAHK